MIEVKFSDVERWARIRVETAVARYLAELAHARIVSMTRRVVRRGQ